MFWSVQSKLWLDQNNSCSSQHCACAVSTPLVNWASGECPEWDLLVSTANTLCSVGCFPQLLLFPKSPAADWCEGVTPQGPQSCCSELPEKRPAYQSTPACRSKSFQLDPFFLSFNTDPVPTESALILPWLVVLLLDIQLQSHQIMPPLQISVQPRLPTVIFPAAFFCRDTV